MDWTAEYTKAFQSGVFSQAPGKSGFLGLWLSANPLPTTLGEHSVNPDSFNIQNIEALNQPGLAAGSIPTVFGPSQTQAAAQAKQVITKDFPITVLTTSAKLAMMALPGPEIAVAKFIAGKGFKLVTIGGQKLLYKLGFGGKNWVVASEKEAATLFQQYKAYAIQVWEAQKKALQDKILALEAKLDIIESAVEGYGPNRTDGSRAYLQQMYKELADLILSGPK